MITKANESIKYHPTHYMLRNDGELFELKTFSFPYISYADTNPDSGDYAKSSDSIKIINDIIETENSWGDIGVLGWLQKHTKSEETRCLIAETATCINAYKKQNCFKKVDTMGYENEATEGDAIEYIHELYLSLKDAINQEFCRIIIDSGSIYFRISSREFNWFNLIQKVVHNRQNDLDDVTIVRDTEEEKYYRHDGKDFNHTPVQEFVTISINPVPKKNQCSGFRKALADGKLIQESLVGMGLVNRHNFYSGVKENYDI